MTRRQSNLLLATCVWTIYIWISFIVIQTRQHNGAAFEVVHGVLALISIGFGVAVGRMGWQARRNAPKSTAPEAAPERTRVN
jgi:hypothetical protein